MRVLLVTSPHVRHGAVLGSDFQRRSDIMYSFVPVGLLSLIGASRTRSSDDVQLFDINRAIGGGDIELDSQFYQAAASQILDCTADVVGFMTECDSYHHILQIARQLKYIKPAVTVVLGGPHASAVAERTMQQCPWIDAVCVGESERSFPDFLEALGSKADRPIPGVWTRGSDARIVFGGPAPLIDSLDQLPLPAFEQYEPSPDEEIFLEVGRGCPFPCTFCSTAPFWGRRHRVKSPARIVKELDLIRSLWGERRVHFTHDLFTTDRNWVRDVCAALISRGPATKWTCSARIDTVDDDLLRQMRAAGCDAIYFGLESGSERMLHLIRKPIALSKSFQVLRSCVETGIKANCGFIVGLLGEDSQSAKDTFDAFSEVVTLGCQPVHIFGFCPFAQSELYPNLPELVSTGHFVDLIIDDEIDTANRRLIASDPTLFGAYHRVPNDALLSLHPGFIDGIDEFSVLVDAARSATVEIAAATGGMLQLYIAWLCWISDVNGERRRNNFYTYYGSPLDFGEFLQVRSRSARSGLGYVESLAKATRTHLYVRSRFATPVATSMATYRTALTGTAPHVAPEACRIGGIIAMESLAHDVSEYFIPGGSRSPKPGRSSFVWQLCSDGPRLLHVSEECFATLVKAGIHDTVLDWNRYVRAAMDFANAADLISEAASLGLATMEVCGA